MQLAGRSTRHERLPPMDVLSALDPATKMGS